jgi:release factor glutamine methyltransferase
MFTYLKQTIVIWLIKLVQKYGRGKVRVLGKTYETSKNVFNPKYYYTSEFMARHINAKPGDIILDIGTGSGIQAVTAGVTASKVTAIDINPEAVSYAQKNVKRSGLEHKVSVMEGDLFSSLKKQETFSVILFTPPYLEGLPGTFFEHALFDPDKKLLTRFFNEARHYLKPGGYVQMLYSSIADHEKALSIARQYGWNYTLTASEDTFSETFLIYRLTLK